MGFGDFAIDHVSKCEQGKRVMLFEPSSLVKTCLFLLENRTKAQFLLCYSVTKVGTKSQFLL